MNTNPSSGQQDHSTERPPERGADYARLLFRTPDGGTIVKDVMRPTTLIGRTPGCNIQLVSDEIGMVHCLLTLDDARLQVRDLRSRSGVLVNGSRIEVSALYNGDRLQIGPFECRVETRLTRRSTSPVPAGDDVPAPTAAPQPTTETLETPPDSESAQQDLIRADDSPAGGEAVYARLRFELAHGRTTAKDILRHTTLIGSFQGCNIQLVSSKIAPAHCAVTLDRGVLRVRDLRSRAGTMVNGTAVDVCELKDGDELQIGAFVGCVETNLSPKPGRAARLHDTDIDEDRRQAEIDRPEAEIVHWRRRAELLEDEREQLSQQLRRFEQERAEASERQQQEREQLKKGEEEVTAERKRFVAERARIDGESQLLREQRQQLAATTKSIEAARRQLEADKQAAAELANQLEAERQRLSVQVNAFEADRRQLAQQQKQSTQQDEQLTQRAAELQRAQSDLKCERQQLEVERREVDSERLQLEADREDLEARRRECAALNGELQSRLEATHSEQSRVQEQEATAARRLAEVEQAEGELQRQRDAFREEKIQFAERQKQFQSDLQELRKKEQAERERARTIEDERSSLEQDRASLEHDRSDLEQQRTALAKEKQHCSEQADELDRIRRQVERQRAEFAEQQQELVQSRSELSLALQEFRERRQRFQTEVGAFETERAEMVALSEELSRAKSEMTRELSALHEQRADFDSRCAKLDEERSRLQALEQELRAREQRIQNESASLQTERDRLATQQQLVSQKAEEQNRRSDDLDKQRTKLETALTELRSGQKRLQADVEQTASLNEQLRKERDTVRAARKQLERQRQQAANSAKELERRLAEAGTSLHAERDRLESLQKALDERTALLNRRTELLKDQVHDVQREQAELRDSRREFEADLRDLRLEYERVRAEASSVEVARGQLEHERLQCELTARELDQLRVELHRQRGAFERERQRLQAEPDTRKQESDEDQPRVPAEHEEHVEAGVSPPEFSVLRLLEELRDLQQRHERCRIERDELHVAQKQLESAVEHFGKKQQLFHERVASFDSDWHRCKQLESRAARARADLDRLELKREDESQQFEQERQQLQAERDELKAGLRRFRERRKRLYEQVAAFQLQRDQEGTPERAESEAPLERDLQRLVQLHEKFRTKKKALHSNKKRLRAEVRRFCAKRRRFREKWESARTGSAWIELRIQRARETLSELHDRQHELKQQRERFRAERADLRAIRNQLESRLESLSARQHRFVHEQLATFLVDFDRLQRLHENAAELLGRLEQALAALRARHQQLPAPSDAVETACHNCREELRVLRSERRRFRRATAALNAARDRLEHAEASAAGNTDLAVAEALIANGIMNRFQADWFLKGRFREYHIDGYRVVDHLDTRALGWLYRAIETATGRQVALKALSERFADDPEAVARFEIEARTGTRLDHPHIVRTLEYDCVDNVHYLTMEFVEGINLREMVDLHGPLSYRQACDLAAQAATGLGYMHDSGLVHRDVKPSNLLVTSDGRLKILDFGLTLVDGDEDEFSLAMIFGHDCLGTADYVAPEQARDSFAVDARADVYSLGCTLFFALTGTVPFAGQSVIEKLEAHRNGDSRAIRKLAPRIPGPVQAIVEKMMASNPAARFPTAPDVAAALSPWGRRVPAYFDFHTVQRIRAARTRRRLYRDATAIRSGRDPMQLTEADADSQPRLAVSRASGNVPRSGVADLFDSG